ncbi:MAG: Ig-like domain-containing protein [SAR324 cluster bacterium]|nr:Ig-like domain-containing protein [SAR324 cluster bacterium]
MPVLIILLITFLSLNPLNLFAQETADTTKKKMFVGKNNRVYIPARKPLYLFVAESPEGPYRALETLKTLKARQKGQKKVYPLVIKDGEGTHTIIHPNEHYWDHKKKKMNDDQVHVIHVDASPPRTWISPSKVKKVTIKGRVVFGKPTQLKIKAADQSGTKSGVQAVFYSQDKGAMTPYTTALDFSLEGRYQLSHYAVDNVGNKAKPKSYIFGIDLTPPTSSYRAKGPEGDGVYSKNTKIVLTSKDNMAGTSYISYKISGPTNKKGIYHGPINISNLKQGDYTITYSATDKVGNKETRQSKSFFLDRSPPKVTAGSEGASYRRGDRIFMAPSSKLTLDTTDGKAGVSSTKYKFGKKYQNYSTPVTLPNQTKSKVSFYALDKVKNESKVKNLSLIKDASKPQTNFSMFGPIFRQGKMSFISRKTKVKLSADDTGSGVEGISYKIDAGVDTPYKRSFTVPEEGKHTIEFYATDRVGNTEKAKKIYIEVDNTPPSISTQFGQSSLGQENGLNVYPRNAILFVVSTDKESGLEKLTYRLGKNSPKEYGEPLRFPRPGKYEVTFGAKDKVNNIQLYKQSFIIK